MSVLLNMLRIRRVEFRIAEIPIILLPVLITLRTRHISDWTSVWLGALVFGFLFAFGDMINCLADRDLDARYKKHLSSAVYSLGLPFVIAQVAISAAAALGIGAYLSERLDRPSLVILVFLGLLLGAGYSVEPVRFKRRGLLQLICLWLIIFVGPMILVAMLVSPILPAASLLFAGAYGAFQMGVILVNTAEDYPEDIAEGVKNTIVWLGLKRGITLAHALTIAGALALLAVMAAIFINRGVPPLWLAILILPLAAASWVVSTIGKLSRSLQTLSLDDAVIAVKQSAKAVPIWITSVAWTSTIAAWTLWHLTTR